MNVNHYKIKQAKKYLHKKIRKGKEGYPIATVAYYGPNAGIATKAVVGIILDESEEVAHMEKWISSMDIRKIDFVHLEMVEFIKRFKVKFIYALGEHILGCPHEEGIDHKEGEQCPDCPYWHDKDRWDIDS